VEGSGRDLILRFYPGVSEENNDPFSQDRQSSGRNLNPGALEYEAGVFF
jgi:hypothetical protein